MRRAERDASRGGADFASHLISSPSPFVARRLVPALIVLYGAVEATGIYEKVSHRQKVTTFLNYLYGQPVHHSAFLRLVGPETARADGDGVASGDFTLFANGIIGHTTLLLDEALNGLASIKETLGAMQDHAAWAALPADERATREQTLDQTTSTVRESFLLANETSALLGVLASDHDVRERLISPELVHRLAAMLVHAMVSLAGPRGVKLKVDDPAKYNFRPINMLRTIVHMILRLADQPTFVAAVAASGMYNADTWDKIDKVIKRVGILESTPPASGGRDGGAGGAAGSAAPTSSSTAESAGSRTPALTVADFAAFAAAVAIASLEAADQDKLYADPPDEFVDPIMGEIYTDPVRTPSGFIYERSCIMQQLMHKAEDPLNRQPLKAEDLVPAADVKARIEVWKAERRAVVLSAQQEQKL